MKCFDEIEEYLNYLSVCEVPRPANGGSSMIHPGAGIVIHPIEEGGVCIAMGRTADMGTVTLYPYGLGFDRNRIMREHISLSTSEDGTIGTCCFTALLNDGAIRNYVRCFEVTELQGQTLGIHADTGAQGRFQLPTVKGIQSITLDAALSRPGDTCILRTVDLYTDEIKLVHYRRMVGEQGLAWYPIKVNPVPE